MRSVAFFLAILGCLSCNVSVMRIEPSSTSAPRRSPMLTRPRFSVDLPSGWQIEERTETVDGMTSVYRNARLGASIRVTMSVPGSGPVREASDASTTLSSSGWRVSDPEDVDGRVHVRATTKNLAGIIASSRYRPCGGRSVCTVTFVAIWPQSDDAAGREAVRSVSDTLRVHE